MGSIVLPFLFLLGIAVGSFINVLVFRFGFLESTRSRSACQACGVTLTWKDLIPVVSFMALRGRCRTCESRLSLQYPLVELLLGVLFVLAFLNTPLFFDWYAVALLVILCVFLSLFTFITVYDVRHTLVPTPAAWGLIGVATLYSVVTALQFNLLLPFIDAVLGAVLLAFFIGLIVLVTRGKGMGVGDVYIAFAIGMMFGVVRGFEVMLIAFWSGALVGIALIVLNRVFVHLKTPTYRRGERIQNHESGFRMKSEVPFVPFLFFGTVVGLFSHFSPLLWIQTFTTILFS